MRRPILLLLLLQVLLSVVTVLVFGQSGSSCALYVRSTPSCSFMNSNYECTSFGPFCHCCPLGIGSITGPITPANPFGVGRNFMTCSAVGAATTSWQRSSDGNTWVNVVDGVDPGCGGCPPSWENTFVGSNTNKLFYSLANTYQYRCKFTAGSTVAYSPSATPQTCFPDTAHMYVLMTPTVQTRLRALWSGINGSLVSSAQQPFTAGQQPSVYQLPPSTPTPPTSFDQAVIQFPLDSKQVTLARMQIRDVQIGDEVLSIDPSGKFFFTPITSFAHPPNRYGNYSMSVLTYQSPYQAQAHIKGTFRLTAGHSIYTLSQQEFQTYCANSQLDCYENIQQAALTDQKFDMFDENGLLNAFHLKRASDVKVGDYLWYVPLVGVNGDIASTAATSTIKTPIPVRVTSNQMAEEYLAIQTPRTALDKFQTRYIVDDIMNNYLLFESVQLYRQMQVLYEASHLSRFLAMLDIHLPTSWPVTVSLYLEQSARAIFPAGAFTLAVSNCIRSTIIVTLQLLGVQSWKEMMYISIQSKTFTVVCTLPLTLLMLTSLACLYRYCFSTQRNTATLQPPK